MATNTLRGDGLVRAHRALAALEENPQRLDHARTRFSDSPPYSSHQSHSSTRSQSLNPPSEEQRRREERLWQLKAERDASLPYYQFGAQRREEEQRLLEAHENRTRCLPVGTNYKALARENVKKRWVEQGIWNNKWTDTASTGVWKLEEASRPFHQFVYQVSKEREQMQDEPAGREAAGGEAATVATAPTDINTRAYENVKNFWIRQKIWNNNWGILPGMSWKHEEPLEEEAANGSASVHPNPLGNDSHEERTSQQSSPSDIDSPGPENGDAQRSPSVPNLPHPGTGEQVLSPTRQTSRPNMRRLSHKDKRPQPLESISLGLAHSPRVPKVPSRKLPGRWRGPNTSEAMPSGAPPPQPGLNNAKPLLQAASAPLRRSKRLQPPEPSMAEDAGRTGSTDSPSSVSRTRPMRTVAGNPKPTSSAKPQGISKRQRTAQRRVTKGRN